MGRVVGSAAAIKAIRNHRSDHEPEPVRIDHAVRIGVGDYLAQRGMEAHVTRLAQSLVRLANQPELGKVHGDFRRPVARSVINDDDFRRTKRLLLQGGKAAPDMARLVVTRDDN